MNAHHIVHGNGKHAVGIIVPQILFGGEGQPLQIFQTLEVAGADSRFVEFLSIEWHRRIDPLGGYLQTAQLNRFERFAGQGFELDVIDHAV